MPEYKLGIVIPTYNESENILELLERIKEQVDKQSIKTLVLIMDDNSPDGTAEVVEQNTPNLESNFLEVRVHVRPGKQGLASAYKQGFAKIKDEVEYLLEMDADLSHQPRYFPQFLKLAEQGYDLVIGSRYVKGGGVEGWTWDRQLISRLGSLYSTIILLTNIRDFTGGYNLYRSSVFDTLKLDSLQAEGYLFQIELKFKTRRAGFRVIESPIIFPDRSRGQSKMSGSIFWEALFGVVKLRLGLLG
jgi:dolichol-phosphate mannosyltransferase